MQKKTPLEAGSVEIGFANDFLIFVGNTDAQHGRTQVQFPDF